MSVDTADKRMPNARGNNDICEWCGDKIETMVFRGTGSCGEEHHKLRKNILRDSDTLKVEEH